MLQIQCCVNRDELQKSYGNMLESNQLPINLKQSAYTPMPIHMTGSLLRIKELLQSRQDIEDITLKAASLEIIRFISILADQCQSSLKDKNKSVSQVLGQKSLKMQYSDILSEMRHALTHKQIPDKLLIIQSVSYILEYLDEKYWRIKLNQELSIISYRKELKQILDNLNDNEYDNLDYPLQLNYEQLENNVLFCLDYIIGLCDFHIIKKTVKSRLNDRKIGDQRLNLICNYILNYITNIYNNKESKKQKIQLIRRKRLLKNTNFIKIYKKLQLIAKIKQKLIPFLDSLQIIIPELDTNNIQTIDTKQVNKKQCIGQLFNQYTISSNNE